jgi:uncharacterized protein YuzE
LAQRALVSSTFRFMEAVGGYFLRSADVAVFRLGNGDGATVEEKDWGLIDFDAAGNVIGFEFRNAARVLPGDLLAALPDLAPDE